MWYEEFLRSLMEQEPVEITPNMITQELIDELDALIALSDERAAQFRPSINEADPPSAVESETSLDDTAGGLS